MKIEYVNPFWPLAKTVISNRPTLSLVKTLRHSRLFVVPKANDLFDFPSLVCKLNSNPSLARSGTSRNAHDSSCSSSREEKKGIRRRGST